MSRAVYIVVGLVGAGLAFWRTSSVQAKEGVQLAGLKLDVMQPALAAADKAARMLGLEAATITLPWGGTFFAITGTTSITALAASWRGRVVTLQFTGALTFTDGGNLNLAGDFATSGDDTITLVCDGSDWFEVCRSSN